MEGLRCFERKPAYVPRLPHGLRRAVSKGGIWIAGQNLPERITVSVPCWAKLHSESNFAVSDSFKPERWLKSGAESSPGEQDRSNFPLVRMAVLVNHWLEWKCDFFQRGSFGTGMHLILTATFYELSWGYWPGVVAEQKDKP